MTGSSIIQSMCAIQSCIVTLLNLHNIYAWAKHLWSAIPACDTLIPRGRPELYIARYIRQSSHYNAWSDINSWWVAHTSGLISYQHLNMQWINSWWVAHTSGLISYQHLNMQWINSWLVADTSDRQWISSNLFYCGSYILRLYLPSVLNNIVVMVVCSQFWYAIMIWHTTCTCILYYLELFKSIKYEAYLE